MSEPQRIEDISEDARPPGPAPDNASVTNDAVTLDIPREGNPREAGKARSPAVPDPTLKLPVEDLERPTQHNDPEGGRTDGGNSDDVNSKDLFFTVDPELNKDVTLDFEKQKDRGARPGTRGPAGRVTGGAADDCGFSLAGEKPKGAKVTRKTVAGYEILGELGRGGMGVVYKARQMGLNRLVALKVVLAGAHADAHQLARFAAEAEAVAGLQHPNVVQIYEVGTHDDLPYFSLEFVDGGNLAEKLDRKPQPPRYAATLMDGIARGMVAAHRQGIIHRDLKPANILLTRDGIPKITDFGLAKRLESDSGQTRSGTLMGTPNYMAPEQAAGKIKEVGPHADQYALGAMLYEMLTGRPPLIGTTITETLELVQKKEPLPPSRLQPSVPRDLETICLKCLQKEPLKRYSSVESLAADVAHFLAGEPIRARPVSRAERVWRWCKRNPRVAALTGVIAVLLVTAATLVTALWVSNARQEAADARRQDDERRAVDETRYLAVQRLEQAGETVKTGDHKRALDMLRWSTPLFEAAPDLTEVRAAWHDLRAQVEMYGEYKHVLDGMRFALYAGSRRRKQHAQEECRGLIELIEQIHAGTGRASAGLPPLSPEQQQLFREDEFEALLIAALLEIEVTRAAETDARQAAARRAIDWLNRADGILPGMRVVYANRCSCWGTLGDADADAADKARAKSITPTTAVDRFWHGYANHGRALEARRNGDQKAAQDLYRKEIAEYAALLQLRPDHFWGYFNWANCQFELGNLHDALVGYCACIRLRPDFPWPFNNRGTIHLRLGELEEARQDYDRAVALDADYAEARANRGMAYFNLHKPAEALADLDRAIQLNPENPLAYDYRAQVRRGEKQYLQSIEDYTRLLALSEDKSAVYLKRADVQHDLGRDDEAVNDCTEALNRNPKNAQAAYKRAGFHVICKNYAQARADYTAVLTLFPTAIEPRRDRATLLWRFLKDFDASLEDWEELARRYPKDAEPPWGIGIICMGQRQYDRALPALRKAVELKPDYVDAVWALAQVAAWQGDLKKALTIINPLAENLPPNALETLNIRGDIYRALGRLDAAAADYRRLIKLRPELVEAYVSLALVSTKQGKPDEAKECYEKLVAANADSAPAYLRRAAFRRAQGDFDAAVEDCTQARQNDPKSVLPGLVEASILAARGADEEAVRKADALLAQAPNDDGQVLYAAACVWSLAARAAATRPDKKRAAELVGQYTDRAATLLQQCLDRGFHDLLYPEHNRMAEDPALAPVRQDPRVSDLLAHRR